MEINLKSTRKRSRWCLSGLRGETGHLSASDLLRPQSLPQTVGFGTEAAHEATHNSALSCWINKRQPNKEEKEATVRTVTRELKEHHAIITALQNGGLCSQIVRKDFRAR